MSTGKRPSGSLLSELKRRNVFRTCFWYIVLSWLALQASDIVAPALGYDEVLVSRYLLYLAVLGFPVTFALPGFFESPATAFSVPMRLWSAGFCRIFRR